MTSGSEFQTDTISKIFTFLSLFLTLSTTSVILLNKEDFVSFLRSEIIPGNEAVKKHTVDGK